jgi:hypothetical protein
MGAFTLTGIEVRQHACPHRLTASGRMGCRE